ncbi:MAG: hypothetical protein ACE5GB_03440, partial [Acidimicrobiales bacterium]
MDFYDQVDRAQELVLRHGRVSRRGLTRELDASPALVDESAHELVVRRVAAWDGDILIAARTEQESSGPDPSGFEGEIRHLTVMFCDVIGSTELSGQIGAEEWTEAMRGFHD